MAECIILKGGGADLDVVTAGADDVLAPKVIVGPDGEPLTGIMPNRGTVSQALGINGTYSIPEGYHNGLGKVTQNIATLGGQTINPTASQQTVSSSGKYMTGNVVVNRVSNLTASNIKKGVNVGGTVGSFEGYVPGATDLYYRGNNIVNFAIENSDYCRLDAGQITMLSFNNTQTVGVVRSTQWVSFVGKSYLHIELLNDKTNTPSCRFILRPNIDSGTSDQDITVSNIPTGLSTVTFDIRGTQTSGFIRLTKQYVYGAIYRIWLT